MITRGLCIILIAFSFVTVYAEETTQAPTFINRVGDFVYRSPVGTLYRTIDDWRISERSYAETMVATLTQRENTRVLIAAGLISDDTVVSREEKINEVSKTPISKSASDFIDSATIGWYKLLVLMLTVRSVFFGLLLLTIIGICVQSIKRRRYGN